jgi:hypothetical protein
VCIACPPNVDTNGAEVAVNDGCCDECTHMHCCNMDCLRTCSATVQWYRLAGRPSRPDLSRIRPRRAIRTHFRLSTRSFVPPILGDCLVARISGLLSLFVPTF